MLRTFCRISLRGLAVASCGALAMTPSLAASRPAAPSATTPAAAAPAKPARQTPTATPIKHLVVIFEENVSFDHYFATYPKAANPPGEPAFHAAPDTPRDIDTLAHAGLLDKNPNAGPQNGADAALPFRLDRTQAGTADQNHGYTAEQAAFDGFKMDLFPKMTGRGSRDGAGTFATKGQVMGYYDGNSVTALWTYAQHYAMSDAAFSTTIGPSTVGAINLVSGQTNGMLLPPGYVLEKDGSYDRGRVVPDGNGNWTMISDLNPTGDLCSSGKTALMIGHNIGDLLNARDVSWGWFQGGFDLSIKNANGTTGCGRTTTSKIINIMAPDYIAHHEPFQYYPSTANPTHKRPASLAAIGTAHDGGARHQYALHDFFDALAAGNLPAVSFLKARAYEDGHAGYSDPIDEQAFLARAVNAIEESPFWHDSAILILYDDSDGWYDHAHDIINSSKIPIAGYDVLDGDHCGSGVPLPGVFGAPVQGRCGHGTRQPFLLISPYAKVNYVDHVPTDQTSVMRFIEDNWLGGQRLGGGSFDALAGSIEGMFDWRGTRAGKLILDPQTGLVKH